MNTPRTIQVASGITHLSYAVSFKDKDFGQKSPFAFDAYDLWFGDDFNYILNNLLDDLLEDIETDISSVDSSNISEAASQQSSAQQSADAQARFDAGIDSALDASSASVSRVSTPDPTVDGTSQETTESADTSNKSGDTPTHTHGHHGWGKDSDAESTFSGVSWSDAGDSEVSGLSDSEGTSQETGEASTLTSVSFILREYEDIYENSATDEKITLLDEDNAKSYFDSDSDLSHGHKKHAKDEFNGITGVEWIGDTDEEIIFGTSWLDGLFGGVGDDQIMGLEGNDYITGGEGIDRLYGGAGNDIMYTGWGAMEKKSNGADQPAGSEAAGDNDFASGGSGDDKIYGNQADSEAATAGVSDAGTGWAEALFGGAGNDYIKAYGGDDTVRGGSGHDYVAAGHGDDDVKGDEGDDELYGNEGNDTVRGGDGDDFVEGNAGNDDLYGDDGDDLLFGEMGDDDVWGGDGDDYILGGQGANVLRGGDGNDFVVAGDGIGDTTRTQTDSPATQHVYGNDGDDAIWGLKSTKKEFLLGGAGDDYIKSAEMAENSKVWGGDGDDFIRQQQATADSTVHAGKGDDTINRQYYDVSSSKFKYSPLYYESSEETALNGEKILLNDPADATNDVDGYGSAVSIPVDVVYGNQGDDEIWGSAKTSTTQHLHGGSGDDRVYAGYGNMGKVYVYGNSGQDVVRSDWYQQYNDAKTNKASEEYLFGDYKYGEDALDKDLWGDDDLIYGGDDTGAKKGWRYGGDGNDTIWTGFNWMELKNFGGNGDDTFYVEGKTKKQFVYGEDGDDVWNRDSYGKTMDASTALADEYGFGGAGDDVIRGSHLNTGKQYLYGGDDEDKIYGGDKITSFNRLTGGAGDDWIEAGDNVMGVQYIYGDSSKDPNDGTDFLNVEYGALNDLFRVNDAGNDVLYGGDNVGAGQWLIGGYGDDKIIGGNMVGMAEQKAFGDVALYESQMLTFPEDHPEYDTDVATTVQKLKYRGLPGDGDDLIDMGDHPDHDTADTYGNIVYGQGGDDKIIGGLTSQQKLYGGDGDDKIWALNPGQTYDPVSPALSDNRLEGGDGDDILYGNEGTDYLYGDFGYASTVPYMDDYEHIGGDDIIYTGEGSADYGSFAFGGVGDDKIYGQGEGDDFLYGNWGDDLLFGGEGDDKIWGDDAYGLMIAEGSGSAQKNEWDMDNMRYEEYGLESGDDTIYGGEGKDEIHAGAGHDYVYGDEGVDTIFASAGEDTIWGGDGGDLLYTGTGWDTVFGGDGCDYIYSQDGGDVIWAGDCDPAQDAADAEVGDTPHDYQIVFVRGTGEDPENYTVVMDFWHEDAMPYNLLCLYPSVKQDTPGAGACDGINDNYDIPFNRNMGPAENASCLTATDILSGRTPVGVDMRPAQNTRNSGCKNDGGPLWITVEIQDSQPIVNSSGAGETPRTVWGKIFQKKQAKTSSRRSRRFSRYAQVGGYPSERKSDLEECMALQLCTASGGAS